MSGSEIRNESRPLPDQCTAEAALKGQLESFLAIANASLPSGLRAPGVLRPARNESPNRSPTALALPVRFGLGEFAALEKVFVSVTYVTLELGMLPGRTPHNHR